MSRTTPPYARPGSISRPGKARHLGMVVVAPLAHRSLVRGEARDRGCGTPAGLIGHPHSAYGSGGGHLAVSRWRECVAQRHIRRGFDVVMLVGAAGFEPTTTSPPDWCATRLRHAPTHGESSTSPRSPLGPTDRRAPTAAGTRSGAQNPRAAAGCCRGGTARSSRQRRWHRPRRAAMRCPRSPSR